MAAITETRRYKALVQVSDPEAIGDFFSDYFGGVEAAELPMDVLGIQVDDFTSFGHREPPFTGRFALRLVPELRKLTWRNTDQSGLDTLMFGKDQKRPEAIFLSNGVVEFESMKLRGTRHPEFNQRYSKGYELKCDHLLLITDRTAARNEYTSPKRRSTKILPLLGNLTLLDIKKK